jgi:hypothetical protein
MRGARAAALAALAALVLVAALVAVPASAGAAAPELGITAPATLVAAINENTYYRASLSGVPAPPAVAEPSAAVNDPAPASGGGAGPALLLAGLGAAGCVALLAVPLGRRRD